MSEQPQEKDAALGALNAHDAAALDAMMESGFDARAAARIVPHGRERIERLARLLQLLDCDAEPDGALVDVTYARLMELRGQKLGSPAGADPVLSPDDDAALEAMVMAGFDASRAPGALRERARRHEALAVLVTASGPVGADDALVERTLARVQSHIDSQEASMNIEAAGGRGGGFRLSDLVSVAAVLLIGAGVLLPILSAVREQTRRTLCRSNLGNTALAMASYATSNRDALPVTTASLGGGTWWEVGKPQNSNSANLFTLTRAGYVPIQTLSCPGNARAPLTAAADAKDWSCLEEVSYSYQIMFGAQRPAWMKGRSVVLADRSPIIPQAIRGEQADPFANAMNHRGAGQHVVHNDGSVNWEKSPVLKSGDNIWLPRNVELVVNQYTVRGRRLAPLKGTETPEAADDTFLGP